MSNIRTSAAARSSSVLRRGVLGEVAFTYGRMPPSEARDTPIVSDPHAIDFAFRGNPRAVIQYEGGRSFTWAVPPMSGGSTGGRPFAWVRVLEPSEFVELRIARRVRQEEAEDARRPDLADLDEVYGDPDPALFAVATRVRAHALGGTALSSLEMDDLARTLLRRRIQALGGRRPHAPGHGLDERRLRRVVDYLEVRLAGPLTTAELADVAAVSRFHFARMFARATSQSPHAFLTSRRMQRAWDLLTAGTSVADAAVASGYVPGHQFRRAFAAQFGVSPGRLKLTTR